jgi:hypothetical protein
VNLIGEHIDFAGLPVFPMALRQQVRIAFRPREDSLVLAATTEPSYAPCTFEISAGIEPYEDGDWGNYLKAAAQGMARAYGLERGFDAVIESTVPVAAGLSSSSALVIATALALAGSNDFEVDSIELAELMAESEQYVGMRGGGMDQAISAGATRGCAARVDFDPLRLDPVPVCPFRRAGGSWWPTAWSRPTSRAGHARDTIGGAARRRRPCRAWSRTSICRAPRSARTGISSNASRALKHWPRPASAWMAIC